MRNTFVTPEIDAAANGLSEQATAMAERGVSAIREGSQRATKFAERGASAVRESSQRLLDRADQASTATVGYIRDEPMKAMLMAAAAGAAVGALVSLLSRPRDR